MIDKSVSAMRDLYRLFTSGLTLAEIERLVKVDARDMYSYFSRGIEQAPAQEMRWKKFLIFIKNLFIAFLLRLSPARRLLYGLSLVLFAYAFLNGSWPLVLATALLWNLLLALELADKLIAKDELAVARHIQLGLLPPPDVTVPGYEVAAFSDAARNVGGDYYDLIAMPDGSTLVAIADVSGKGISAALYMVKVQSLLQLFSRESSDLKTLLVRLEQHLSQELQRNYFLTMSLARLYPDGRLVYCRAGHLPLLLLEAGKKNCTIIEPRGSAIGLSCAAKRNGGHRRVSQQKATNGAFDRSLQVEERRLRTGDILVLLTDGVIETLNSKAEEYGDRRLQQVLCSHTDLSPLELRDALLDDLTSFRGGATLHDDTTFVILQKQR